MGRGKISNEKIMNPTNRQVTFSKRKKGLFKKATELSILCDAQVSIIIISSGSNKLSEFISDSTTMKQIFDRYQKAQGIDLWKNKYEKMQEELRKLKEKNSRLRREMRQRMGEDLSEFNFFELHRLEQEMEASFAVTRSLLLKKINTKTNTLKKKTKPVNDYYNSQSNNYIGDVEPKMEHVYGTPENGGAYDSAAANAASHIYALRLRSHFNHLNLHYTPVLVEPHQFRLV